MASVTRGGASTHYEVTGDGPAVLLGHSLLCDGRMWEEVAPRLAASFRVVNVDFRGHRRSTAPAPFSLEDLARDYLAVMDQEGIERAAFVGLSMGGMAAMRAALLAPERVAGLVLLDTSAGPEDRWARVQYELMALVFRRLGLLRPLEGRVLPLMFGPETLAHRPELVERFRAWVDGHDRASLVRAVRAVNRRADIGARLPEIDCPALVVVGEHDRATPPARAREIHARLRGSRLEILRGAGHLSAVERPERVAELALSLLETCAAGGGWADPLERAGRA